MMLRTAFGRRVCAIRAAACVSSKPLTGLRPATALPSPPALTGGLSGPGARASATVAAANPESVWEQIVEMFAINGDTNYGPPAPVQPPSRLGADPHTGARTDGALRLVRR